MVAKKGITPQATNKPVTNKPVEALNETREPISLPLIDVNCASDAVRSLMVVQRKTSDGRFFTLYRGRPAQFAAAGFPEKLVPNCREFTRCFRLAPSSTTGAVSRSASSNNWTKETA